MKTTEPVCNKCGETHPELFNLNGHGGYRRMCERCEDQSRLVAAAKGGDIDRIAKKFDDYRAAVRRREKFYRALEMKQRAEIKRKGVARV
jgi:hypothetical protein